MALILGLIFALGGAPSAWADGLEDANAWYAEQNKGNHGLAIRDYDEARRLDPDHGDTHTRRGRTHFYLARFAKAAADLGHAVDASPESHYKVLWLYLAEARSGNGSQAALERNAKKLDLGEWPGPVVRLYLGDTSKDSVLAAARDSGPQRQKEKQCEAYFYLGQLALLDGNTG